MMRAGASLTENRFFNNCGGKLFAKTGPILLDSNIRAHELFPGNGLICYWLIMATYSLSGADMAKKEYFRLKDDMTQEEIDVVTEHLKKNSLIRYEELFGV